MRGASRRETASVERAVRTAPTVSIEVLLGTGDAGGGALEKQVAFSDEMQYEAFTFNPSFECFGPVASAGAGDSAGGPGGDAPSCGDGGGRTRPRIFGRAPG